jgi:hypothetical protein|tara:strand:+ start:3611 stop:4540 length:930 start_codon:yes stop_codon:yes gene_type:complete
MDIITWFIYNSTWHRVGDATLFPNNHMILEIVDGEMQNEGLRGNTVEIIAGGQEGMVKWLKNNDLRLNNRRDPAAKSIVGTVEYTSELTKEQKEIINLAFGSLSQEALKDADGNEARVTVAPCAINNHTLTDINNLIGDIEPNMKPWIMIVDSGDADISALLSVEDFKIQQTKMNNSVSISYMMEGGRSGSGYIMAILLPDLQAEMLLVILNTKRRGAMAGEDSKMQKYIMGNYPIMPLPEFRKRHDWMRGKIAEHQANPNLSVSSMAVELMFTELKHKIKDKDPDVYNLSSSTYDDTRLMKIIKEMHK